ncbi:hypothetical protein R3W88_013441 [Solanum pinnatisectum]|uniref:CP12 domain-containing protein n=1 Tax=Solanum pinnatisectum TaxID=50273 RepID=A0AAV9LD66_9SOLN|nr:hypothetical protein R3W88_013441 [Solanum pinnatisectum]
MALNLKQTSIFPINVASVTGSTRKGVQKVMMRGSGSAGVPKYKGTQMREKQLTEMIEKKVKEAKEVCGEDARSDECKVAWDEVEEVSQAKAHLRIKLQLNQDPLEPYCQDNPDADECRTFDH